MDREDNYMLDDYNDEYETEDWSYMGDEVGDDSDYDYDGQPTEMDEWLDFDPDC
jgi:hypothetical protein